MSDIIQLLPDSVANQIAAGEVIQRPASIIKELVENSIDAGATEITICIKEAGRTLVQIIDNGKGMSMTDARLAFERHATSKIRSANDLFALQTMGFRGEALASIAAVAQVELKTRRPEDDLGTRILIAGSEVELQEPVSTPAGSNFAVKNLFFNVPARRKFLKSNQTELSNILSEFERLALVNPGVAFRVFHNDTELHQFYAQNTKQRIVSLYGRNMGPALLPVEVSTSLVSVSGFVSTPAAAKKRGAHQFFFVNGRYMRHPYFTKAVQYCYEGLITQGEQPQFFLYLTVDPSSIDVNIHPTKTEIKFENEQAIWQMLAASIKESLGRFNAVPSIDFDQIDAPSIPTMGSREFIPPPKVTVDPTYNPFNTTPSVNPTYTRSKASFPPPSDWHEVYDSFRKEKPVQAEPQTEIIRSSKIRPMEPLPELTEMATFEPEENDENVLIEQEQEQEMLLEVTPENQIKIQAILTISPKYLAVSTNQGYALVHKRRAHARLLYEQFYSNILAHKADSQKLLFPELIELSPSEVAIMDDIQEELFASGFELSDLGGGTYSLLGVPASVESKSHIEILRQMIDSIQQTGISAKENIAQSLALTMADNFAYSDDKPLSENESYRLLEQLVALSAPTFTADGRRIIYNYSDSELEKLFN